MKSFNVFNGVLGLNTKEHPVSLARTAEGQIELAEAVNIDISNRYKPTRRKGQVSTDITSFCHSFYNAGDYGLCVSGTDLIKVSASYTTTVLRSGLTDSQSMSYCEMAGKVFYANGYENGYIEDDSDNAWSASQTYMVVDTSRSFSKPPVGHKLIAAFGRIWIAQDNVLWFTESFSPFLCDLVRNAIPFNNRIKEVIPIADGFIISTTSKTVFLSGTDPWKMYQLPVVDYPLIPGTFVQTNVGAMPDLRSMRIERGPVWVGCSSKGICVLANGGFFQNLSRHKIDMPTASEGCAYIYNGKYVVNLK